SLTCRIGASRPGWSGDRSTVADSTCRASSTSRRALTANRSLIARRADLRLESLISEVSLREILPSWVGRARPGQLPPGVLGVWIDRYGTIGTAGGPGTRPVSTGPAPGPPRRGDLPTDPYSRPPAPARLTRVLGPNGPRFRPRRRDRFGQVRCPARSA